MRNIIFFLLFTLFSSAQSYDNPGIYGLWKNLDDEYVKIELDNSFKRFEVNSKTKEIITKSYGYFEIIDKELHIVRKDTTDTYKLVFFVNYETMVIARPRSDKAWLWYRIGN